MSAAASSPSSAGGLAKAILRKPLVIGSGVVLIVIVLLAAFAPLLSPYDPNVSDLSSVLAPPGADHLLGGDGSGRDVLSRLLWGARLSLLAGVIATVTAIVLGVPTGLVAGYRQGAVDAVGSWLSDVLMSIPGIVALLVVVAAFGTSMPPTMIALGVLMAPGFFRLTRATVVSVRSELYIDAAKVAGLSGFRITFKHILAVVITPILIQASLTAGVAIIVQSGLGFLGIGDPLVPSWGSMVNDAYRNNSNAPQLILWPGLAIGITVAALALLGSGISDVLNRTGSGALSKAAKAARAKALAKDAERPASSAAESMLSVENLRVAYPASDGLKEVVHGISFEVRRGECLGIVGESGSGKSQSAFAVLGLLPSDAIRTADRVQLEDVDLLTAGRKAFDKVRATRIAYIPQDPMSNLDPAYTVGAQIIETIRSHERVSRADAKARARDLLEQVGINDPDRTLAAYPHEISGGMAQRVLIAIAVSCNPEYIVADEPTTALDVTVQAEVLALLRRLQEERDLGVILVTHNLGVVADICDRVAVMKDGEIIETADVFALFADPQHPYTQELLGSTLSGSAPRSRVGDRVLAGSATEAPATEGEER